jgi:hypothetical protein
MDFSKKIFPKMKLKGAKAAEPNVAKPKLERI